MKYEDSRRKNTQQAQDGPKILWIGPRIVWFGTCIVWPIFSTLIGC